MTDRPTLLNVPATRVEVNLAPLLSLADGENGTLVQLTFHHEPYYPHMSGPVLRYRLPNGRVVRAQPASGGYELHWDDGTAREAVLDSASAEALHLMWDACDAAFQNALLPAFHENVTRAVRALEPVRRATGSEEPAEAGTEATTVGDLIAALSRFDPATPVVLASDEEGNDFHTLAAVEDAVYDGERTWLTPEQFSEVVGTRGYTEDDAPPDIDGAEVRRVAVLWP